MKPGNGFFLLHSNVQLCNVLFYLFGVCVMGVKWSILKARWCRDFTFSTTTMLLSVFRWFSVFCHTPHSRTSL